MGFRDRYYTKTSKDMNVSGRDMTSEVMEDQHLDPNYQERIWEESNLKGFSTPVDIETSHLLSKDIARAEAYDAQHGFTMEPKRWEREVQYTTRRQPFHE
jgi:hypothetical protein